jgi:photosystem II stability/assembly factor-like uncharacterized protein
MKLLRYLLAHLIALAATALSQPNSWEWQAPLPQGNSLLDVIALPSGLAVAVGEFGTILRSTDTGLTWSVERSGVTQDLRGVCTVDNYTLVAVGDSGVILRSTDEGVTWNLQAAFPPMIFRDVVFFNARDGMAGGPIGEGDLTSAFVRTSNGGVNWTLVDPPTTWNLLGLASRDSMSIVAVGDGPVHLSSDRGATWISPISGQPFFGWSIAFSGPLYGAIGAYRWDWLSAIVLTTTDAGGSWDIHNVPGPAYRILGISLPDESTIVTVGSASAQAGFIARSSDRGGSWQLQSPGGDLYAVSFVNGSTGMAVGLAGLILRTEDGGEHWTRQVQNASNRLLFGVGFADLNHGIAAGESGRVLHTTDGGTNWIEGTTLPMNLYFGVSYPSPALAFAVGGEQGVAGTIMRTTDAGLTWSVVHADSNHSLWDIDFVSATNGIATGSSGIILRTTDGGETWTPQSSGVYADLRGVKMVDSLTAFVAASGNDDGIILRTTDAGGTWSSVFDAPGAFSCVDFINAIQGWVAGPGWDGASDGIIVRTTDGGTTWEYPDDFQVVGNFYGIDFADAFTGYVAGTSGLVLKSTDGGTTWTEIPLRTYGNLYGVAVRDANHVTVVGSLGAILATSSGGVLGVPLDEAAIPVFPRLTHNYPNPFNPQTTIEYSLPERTQVSLTVYSLLGQLVQTLVDEPQGAGVHRIRFSGDGLSSGVYFYRLVAGTRAVTHRMILLR